MAKHCNNCGKELSFLSYFSNKSLCSECEIEKNSKIAAIEEEKNSRITAIEEEIIQKKEITEEQKEFLRKQDKSTAYKIYSYIYDVFEKDKELEEEEIITLQNVQSTLGLSNEDIRFDDRVRPYIFVHSIKKDGRLPQTKLEIQGGQVILKKGEVVHHADNGALNELKTVDLGYSGSSQGVSFRIMRGVTYRVGSHRGHLIKQDRIVESSRGILIITNQRLFLNPFPGRKPVSIPLNKILSYHCYNNGIEVYKEGRDKGYFFSINKSGSVEIFGLCLGYLLSQGN